MRSSTTPRLVAIVGGSGAGKSWLTDRLQKVFGEKAARLSLDDFYLDRSRVPARRRARINFDHPRAIDWRLVEQFLNNCRAGRVCRLPRYDLKTHTRRAVCESWHPKPLVLIEGLWLLLRPAIRRFFDFAIFIDCPAELRLQRRLARDRAERGRSRPSIQRQFRETVAPMHDLFVSPQAQWADVVLGQPMRDSEIHQLSDQLWSLLTTGSLYPAWMRETFRAETRALLKPVYLHE
jgi:uridine kinase